MSGMHAIRSVTVGYRALNEIIMHLKALSQYPEWSDNAALQTQIAFLEGKRRL